MVSRLVLLLGLFTAMCGAPDPGPDGRIRAHIAEDAVLTLPMAPAYPETRTLSQVVRARYGELDGAFETVLSLSPTEATIVITVLGGPRLATVHWDESGVREERTLLAPTGVPVENILADMFLVQWPEDVVAEALPDDVELVVEKGMFHVWTLIDMPEARQARDTIVAYLASQFPGRASPTNFSRMSQGTPPTDPARA